MLRVLLITFTSLCLYLGYQNHKLAQELSNIKSEPKPTCVSPSPEIQPSTPTATAERSADQHFNEKLSPLKEELQKIKNHLNSLLAKRDELRSKLKSMGSLDPIEHQRQLKEKKEELARLEKESKEIKSNNAPITQSPRYADLKSKLSELEKRVHEIKTSKNPSINSKAELSQAREELKKIQQERRTYLESTKFNSGGYTPVNFIKNKVKVLKKGISQMEKNSPTMQEEESRSLKTEIEKSEEEIKQNRSKIQHIENSISEIKNQ